jgi:hypothetical protein
MSKRVLIIGGSPRKAGNSNLLCDQFMKGVVYGVGAWEAGEVTGTRAMQDAYEMGRAL